MMYHIHYIVVTLCVTFIIFYTHGVSQTLYCTHMMCNIHYIVLTWCVTCIIL